MAVIYTAGLRTVRMQAVADAIDAGSVAGKLKIGTAAMGVVLGTIILAEPCGIVSGDMLVFDTSPVLSDVSADNSGTAAEAVLMDSDDNVIVSGLTVGILGTNIVLDSVAIVAGQTITINSAVLVHNTVG